MLVRDLLQRKRSETVTVRPGDWLITAAQMLMSHGIGALPVVEAGVPIGLLSERDIVRAAALNVDGLAGTAVEQIMRRPAPTCSADDPIPVVMARMTRDRLRHLVVTENGRLAGVISVGDLVKDRLDELETETGVLRDYVAGQRAGSTIPGPRR
jgi:CBS domain-containing protein